MNKLKTWWLTGLTAVLLMTVMVPSVFAMEDGKRELNRQLTVAEAVGLIADKFGLSPADMPFVGEEDINPDGKITKELFAHLVQQAIDAKGDFAYIMMYVLIEDEADINPAYMGSIQKMLLTGLMSLDQNGKFLPHRPVYRYYAIDVIDRALAHIGEQEQLNGQIIQEDPEEEARIEVEKVTDEVNRVTVFRTVPHPGYGLAIDRIEFTPEGTAVIYYSVTEPDPDMMYPQVISEAQAETFVSARYTPVARPAK